MNLFSIDFAKETFLATSYQGSNKKNLPTPKLSWPESIFRPFFKIKHFSSPFFDIAFLPQVSILFHCGKNGREGDDRKFVFNSQNPLGEANLISRITGGFSRDYGSVGRKNNIIILYLAYFRSVVRSVERQKKKYFELLFLNYRYSVLKNKSRFKFICKFNHIHLHQPHAKKVNATLVENIERNI